MKYCSLLDLRSGISLAKFRNINCYHLAESGNGYKNNYADPNQQVGNLELNTFHF